MRLKIILIIIIPILILLFNFKLLVFNLDYYEKEFNKYKVYDKFSKEEVDSGINELFMYLKEGKEIEGDFFSERDKLHLRDVRNLIQSSFLLFYIFLGLFLVLLAYFIYIKNYKGISSSLVFGGGLTILVLLIILFLVLLDFNKVFLNFHYLVFRNDFWVLDPAKDNLINLFPQGFFYDISKKIFLRGILSGLAISIIGLLLVNFRNFLAKTLNKQRLR